ncbi:MAG TPA: hypothetical protein PK971_14330, partial [Saprospiraceae bacterium]|nr:hypothetical protein [Saprospiraceae bacterium]
HGGAGVTGHATIDRGTSRDGPFLVLEYLAGYDLDLVIERLREVGGRMPWQLAVQIIISTAEGMAYAHALPGNDGKPAPVARVLAQMAEIDALNAELAPFRIFKGIESDILNDGALDYEEELLGKFDFIVASVHSNLKMSREKATERVLRAIRHPRTTILGHPTGRLLLSREGYPLDWPAVMDACAEHGVALELNANPHRLDLDWSLIPEATRRGIRISINPDAHSREGIHHMRYGVMAARKGGLRAADCLNALGAEAFAERLRR